MHRLASAAPLGVFHRTTELSTLNGYSVPANSIVIGNIGAAHRDARVFPDPEKFDPNRFLHKEGNFVKSPYVVPFSIGNSQFFVSRRFFLRNIIDKSKIYLNFLNVKRNKSILCFCHAILSLQADMLAWVRTWLKWNCFYSLQTCCTRSPLRCPRDVLEEH